MEEKINKTYTVKIPVYDTIEIEITTSETDKDKIFDLAVEQAIIKKPLTEWMVNDDIINVEEMVYEED